MEWKFSVQLRGDVAVCMAAIQCTDSHEQRRWGEEL